MGYEGHADTMRSMMTVEDLVAVAQVCAEKYPGADLVKNGVGNLLIVVDGQDVGYIDLFSAEAHGWDGWESNPDEDGQ